jgi:uncharacterized delta-60 repeat protein
MRRDVSALVGLALSLIVAGGPRPCEASGGIDSSMGPNGYATVLFTNIGGYHPAVLAPDGTLVGMAGYPPAQQLYRAFSDGTLDPSFGQFGFVDLPSSSSFSSPEYWGGIAVQPDGRIVVTANVANGAGGWLVRRYMPDGAPDASFGVAGEVALFPSPGFYDSSPTVTVQDDGKLVLAGQRSLHASLARIDSAGALDPSFGVGGTRIINYGGGYEYFGPVRLQPDGKLLTTLFSTFGSANGAFAFARFNDDGSDDTGFGGGDGLVSFRVTPAGQQTSDVALLPDGRILMTGVSHYDIPQRNFIAYRFNSDGSLDGSFGNGGGVAYDLAGGADDESRSIVLLPSGQFLLVGQIEPPGPSSVQVGAARFDADGTLDTTFGTAGVAVATVDNFSQQTAPSVLPDGDILVPGSSFPAEGIRHFYLRFTMCGPCDVLGAGGACVGAPPSGCLLAATTHSSSIAIRDFGTDRFDRLKWSLKLASATSSTDFGNPSVGSPLRLCMFTGSSANPSPLSRTFVAAGGQCGSAPCWKALGAGALGGWKLKDRQGSSDGVTQLTLKPGNTVKAKLTGKGDRLRMPGLPIAGTLRVRLQSASGKCWEASFAAPTRNTATDYKARN